MIDYLHNEFSFNKDGFHLIFLRLTDNDSRTMSFPISDRDCPLIEIYFNFYSDWYCINNTVLLIHKKTRNSGNYWTLLRNITKEEDRGATEFQIAICKLFSGQ